MTLNSILKTVLSSSFIALTVCLSAQSPILPTNINDVHGVSIVPADTTKVDTVIYFTPLSQMLFLPPVYTTYQFFDEYKPFEREIGDNPAFHWIEKSKAQDINYQMTMQRLFVNRPDLVPLNIRTLPEAPKQYVAEVNPKDHTIEIREVKPVIPSEFEITDIKKRHWIRSFDASLQFSQAYISPNWYQGGKNNLNMLLNVVYNVKLNPAYHPNLLFESTFRYKLGMNSAPDDELRNYSISEDLFQANATLGIKAAKRWYYSVAAQFKTQIFNSYTTNTMNLKSAFLSPAELNVGLGMTYNFVNKKKTVTFDASISPLTYNLKICTNMTMNHEDYGIEADKTTKNKFGSSGELKFSWQIAKNILFSSRLFSFTDYETLQADWENTLSMSINRFLSTQIYCHLRYDTNTPRDADNPNWHKLQIKEILSFGFAYKFSTI